MRGYLIKLDKELLELGALEMDPALGEIVGDKETVDLINTKNEVRTLTVNRKEGLLQGRGIKGFFKSYSSEYVFADPGPGGIRISEFEAVSSRCLDQLPMGPAATERTGLVLEAVQRLKTGNPKNGLSFTAMQRTLPQARRKMN